MKVPLNIDELLRAGRKKLKDGGIQEYALDCQLFLMEATGFEKTQLYTQNGYIPTEEQAERFWSMLEKRLEKVPTQYILGWAYFMDMIFKVSPHCLIPRPDTEILVETVLAYAREEGLNKVIDVGTGSGCIAVSLKKNGIKTLWAVDISSNALAIARENAASNRAEIVFVESDLFQGLPEDERFDAIVSNPPYIAAEEIDTLMKEVRLNEPRNALDGGRDGLDFYRRIVATGKNRLRKDGWIFFEIGCSQGEEVSKLLQDNGFNRVKVVRDLAGLDRVVLGKKAGED